MMQKSDGFVRADQIDLKSIDEQLERHLNKALAMDKMKQKEEDDSSSSSDQSKSIAPCVKFKTLTPSHASSTVFNNKLRQDWEIDPSNLIIKSVIARGTFGTVHRGVYDAQDVAGNFH